MHSRVHFVDGHAGGNNRYLVNAMLLAVTTTYQQMRTDISGDHRFARLGCANAFAFHYNFVVF